MKYYRPETIAEATDFLREAPDAKIIAGGQSMMPLLRQGLVSPSALVDVTRIEQLDEVSSDGDRLAVGALVTYQELLGHPVCEELALLRDALEAIGDVQVRNAGTIGGGVAHADPAQDLPPALLCYETDVVISDGTDQRVCDLAEFFVDFYFTDLAPDEIVTRVEIDRPPAGAGGAFAKHARTPGGFSEAGVAALVVPGDDDYADVRLAYCAGGPVPSRVPDEVEAILEHTDLDHQTISEAADHLVAGLDQLGDVDQDGAYAEHVFRVLTKRAMQSAARRSDGPPLSGGVGS